MRNLYKLFVLLVFVSNGMATEPIKIEDRDLKEQLILADNATLRAQNSLNASVKQAETFLRPLQDRVRNTNIALNVIVAKVFETAGIPVKERTQYSFDAEFNLVKRENTEESTEDEPAKSEDN